MDALALLCHLSADGTSALVRLRHAGYASLQDVLLAEDEELAQVLGASAGQIARLRLQAESLEDRVGADEEADPRPALARRAPPRPIPGPASRVTPLLCPIETEPLADDDPGADAPAEAPAREACAPRAESDPPPEESQATERFRSPFESEGEREGERRSLGPATLAGAAAAEISSDRAAEELSAPARAAAPADAWPAPPAPPPHPARRARYWMPLRPREPERPDPGPSGPFA